MNFLTFSFTFTDLEKEPLVPESNVDDLGYLDLTLRPTDESLTKQQMVHKMHLFKMKLLHFVNSLNNYIMTRVGSVLHEQGFFCIEYVQCVTKF